MNLEKIKEIDNKREIALYIMHKFGIDDYYEASNMASEIEKIVNGDIKDIKNGIYDTLINEQVLSKNISIPKPNFEIKQMSDHELQQMKIPSNLKQNNSSDKEYNGDKIELIEEKLLKIREQISQSYKTK